MYWDLCKGHGWFNVGLMSLGGHLAGAPDRMGRQEWFLRPKNYVRVLKKCLEHLGTNLHFWPHCTPVSHVHEVLHHLYRNVLIYRSPVAKREPFWMS